MSSTSDLVYTYTELRDLTVAEFRRVLADTVIHVQPGQKFGWRCEPCHEDSGLVFNRALAEQMLRHHCKTREHRSTVSSPTRFNR